MKKIILILSLTIYFAGFSKAQLVAPDFTLKNTLGESYNLYDELDAGKSVVMSFFSISCGPCSEEVPDIQALKDANNEEAFTLMAVETFLATNEEIDSFITVNGGAYSGFSTLINNEVLGEDMYDITFTPINVVVCPDRTYKKAELGEVQLIIDNCAAATRSQELEALNYSILNVANADEIVVHYHAADMAALSFELIDILGNIRYSKQIETMNGKGEVRFDKSNLLPGYYFVRMMEKSHMHDLKKIAVY